MRMSDWGSDVWSSELAVADLQAPNVRKLVEKPIGDAFAQGFKQVDVGLRAFADDGAAQLPVVQYGLYVLVVDLMRYIDIEFGVDVQRLGGAQLVLQNTDAGVKGKRSEERRVGKEGEVRV